MLLLGTHGQENIGDELLLDTFLTELGPAHRYIINSYAPTSTFDRLQRPAHVEVIDTAGERIRLMRALVRSDAVVFGGGSIVKELYRSVGRWRYATLAMLLVLVVAARLCRCRVFMVGVGVGPLPSPLGRCFAAAILRCTDLVAVRDEASRRACRRLGVSTAQLTRMPDPAFANSPDDFGPARPLRLHTRATPVRIALNLNRDIANGERWDDVLDEITEALDIASRRGPIEVHGVPMQSGFKRDDDHTVLTELFARRPHWNGVVHRPADHSDVAAILRRCDVVVAERFHAIVIAAICGRPTVGLMYDVKVAELAIQLGIESRSFDINAPFPPEALADAMLATAAAGAREGQRLASAAARFRSELTGPFAAIRRALDTPGEPPSWGPQPVVAETPPAATRRESGRHTHDQDRASSPSCCEADAWLRHLAS